MRIGRDYKKGERVRDARRPKRTGRVATNPTGFYVPVVWDGNSKHTISALHPDFVTPATPRRVR